MSDGKIERVVPNPEKKQILKLAPGSTIVTEIEQIARIYPYDSPKELQVKSVVNYLIEELTFDQITRLQRVTEAIIDGRMDSATYLRTLMADLNEGGLGIPVARASQMTERLMNIIDHARDIFRYRRSRGPDVTQMRSLEFINRLAEFLSTQFDFQLTSQQKANFERSIEQRIGGFTKRDDFWMQMELPVSERGVGLNKKQAFDVTRLMEKLIAQGIPRVGEAHH
jgi:hypothetical protein